MLIPYSTDAPIYHLPIVTVNMIALNTAAFFGTVYLANVMPEDDFAKLFAELILTYGNGWRPWQWITSSFMHADFLHLLGNMFCLWGFGLVVEGKVGWWRFLLIYFGLGIFQNCFEQSIMLFASEGGSLGASSIVYGLLVIAMLWAPENEMSCLFFFFIRVFAFDVKLSSLAAFAIFIEVGTSMFAGIAMTSQILHIMGAVAGFAVGFIMLRQGWVDCEGWDFFSVWSGSERKESEEETDAARALIAQAENHRMAAVSTSTSSSPAGAVPEDAPIRLDDDDAPLRLDVEDTPSKPLESSNYSTIDDVRGAIAAGNSTAALMQFRRLPPSDPPPERELLQVITLLHQQRQWSTSIPAIVFYLRRFHSQASRLRLRLAHVLIDVEKRPRQALRVLSQVNPNDLAVEERTTLEQLTVKAEQQRSVIHEERPLEDY